MKSGASDKASAASLDGGKQRYIVFSLVDQIYAFPLMEIQEVLGLAPITPVPNVPPYYRGLINLRGKIISVIDLRLKFGLRQEVKDSPTTTTIICRLGDSVIGCIVDEVLQVEAFSNHHIDSSGSRAGRDVGEGVIGVAQAGSPREEGDGKKAKFSALTLILSIEKVLNARDRELLSEVKSDAAATQREG